MSHSKTPKRTLARLVDGRRLVTNASQDCYYLQSPDGALERVDFQRAALLYQQGTPEGGRSTEPSREAPKRRRRRATAEPDPAEGTWRGRLRELVEVFDRQHERERVARGEPPTLTILVEERKAMLEARIKELEARLQASAKARAYAVSVGIDIDTPEEPAAEPGEPGAAASKVPPMTAEPASPETVALRPDKPKGRR